MVYLLHSTQQYNQAPFVVHRFGKVKGADEGHSSVKGLIWMSRLNVVAVAYAAAANVAQCSSSMLEELWTVTYALRGARKYGGLTDIINK
jgi:hypothetical protein